MDLNYKTELLFPTPLHIFDIVDFNDMKDELVDYAYQKKSENDIGVSKSNVGGWQSRTMSDKSEKINSLLIDIVREFPAFKEEVNFYMDSWININKFGDSNTKHTHPASDLSGVLWIKIPDKSGNLVFVSPHQHYSYGELYSYSEEFKDSTTSFLSYETYAREGRLIIFPSYALHSVQMNKSKEDRISASFNIIINI